MRGWIDDAITSVGSRRAVYEKLCKIKTHVFGSNLNWQSLAAVYEFNIKPSSHFALSNAPAGTIFGNFSTSSGAPSYQSSGTANQVLGVQTGGSGLEFKTIVPGANVTVTNTAGEITIASTTSASFPLINQCRLYGVTGSCYSDVTSSPFYTSTIYFGPCPDRGNAIFLYTSGVWGGIEASETSLSISSLSNGVYDVFVYNNSGSVAIAAPVAWSSGAPTNRTVSAGGVIVNSSNSSQLYVGTIQVIGGVVYCYSGNRGIWNAYNRIQAPVIAQDTSSADWTYDSTTGRIANGQSNTSYGVGVIQVVTGEQIEPINLTRFVRIQPDQYGYAGYFGIGTGTTGSATIQVEGTVDATSYTDAAVVTGSVSYATVQMGAQYYASMEYVTGGICVFWGGSYSRLVGTTWW